MKSKKIIKIMLIVNIILILVDQVSKALISKFVLGDITILQNVLAISKIENEGIAFGINKENISNIVLTILVLAIIIRFAVIQRKNLTPKTTVYLSLMIAGGISNLIDRLFRGAVLDFIQIGDFPVFNFADIFIVVGWVLFVIDLIKKYREIK